MAVEQCLDDNVFDKASWASLPCYVVGEGTAKVVKEKFGMISIGQECGNARQLAQEISKGFKHVTKTESFFHNSEPAVKLIIVSQFCR